MDLVTRKTANCFYFILISQILTLILIPNFSCRTIGKSCESFFHFRFKNGTHAARVVPMTPETGVKYYLDENRDYCVPKRSSDEIARTL